MNYLLRLFSMSKFSCHNLLWEVSSSLECALYRNQGVHKPPHFNTKVRDLHSNELPVTMMVSDWVLIYVLYWTFHVLYSMSTYCVLLYMFVSMIFSSEFLSNTIVYVNDNTHVFDLLRLILFLHLPHHIFTSPEDWLVENAHWH